MKQFFKAPFTSYLLTNLFVLLSTQPIFSQASKETTQPLSKPAQKGWLDNASLKEGSIVLSYAMKIEKKSDQLNYEDYVFDQQLNFKGMQPGKEAKQNKPDIKKTVLRPIAGGSNSFNVLSQKLSILKGEGILSWDYKRQRYELDKILSSDKIKMKNGEDRYDGFVSYTMENGAFIIASFDPGKNASEQFVVLFVDDNMNVKETPVTTGGNYSLVFSGIRNSGNPFVIMAPKNKMPDIKQYVYAEFTATADLVKRTNFISPSPNMMVMNYDDQNGDLYLFGASTKSADPYEEEFTDWATIGNPQMGFSRQGQKYGEAVSKKTMAHIHLLKLKDGELVLAGTTPVKNFEDKVIAPPGQKKKHSYEGKFLHIETFTVTPAGEYLVAGQLMDKDFNIKSGVTIKFKDIVGFYFNSKGELKAQYTVEKMNDDNKSEMFESQQNFFVSQDGKKAYWEILEVKGSKGYANYWDAVAGRQSYTANYFPRLSTIDLNAGSLSEFTVLGNGGKFLVYKRNAKLIDDNTIYYIGHDDDFEKLWVGKFEIK